MEYTIGDITLSVDFEDCNGGGGLKGRVENRRISDLTGKDVTQNVVGAINDEFDANAISLPPVQRVIGQADRNGEIIGKVFTNFVDLEGQVQDYEEGTY